MYITLRKTGAHGAQYYYTIHDRQPGLFQAHTLIAVWGPNPDSGRRKVYSFDTRDEKDEALRHLIRKRIGDGYAVLYSYARSKAYRRVFDEFDRTSGTGTDSSLSNTN